jgi:hypothetical protein
VSARDFSHERLLGARLRPYLRGGAGILDLQLKFFDLHCITSDLFMAASGFLGKNPDFPPETPDLQPKDPDLQ